MARIYLDWNATTPPRAEVLAAMARAATEAWANPASIHGDGRKARALVEDARARIATLAAADPRDVVFTSGGTEANNLALRSAFAAAPGHLVTSRLEHPSVTRVAEALEAEGRARVTWLPVAPSGVVELEALERVLREGPVTLVAVQALNHETGVLQPVEEVVALAHRHGARVHVDAVQAFGRVDAVGNGADTRSLAAHKLRGPKGIGALVQRPSLRLAPLLLGGAQERGLRPGTVDAANAVGFGVAAQHAGAGPSRYAAVAALRDGLEEALLALGAEVNGGAPRAPHVTNVYMAGWSGPELVAALDLEGVSVSSGAACSAGTVEASPVITAMRGAARAAASVRFSLGETTTDADIAGAVAALRRVVFRGAGGGAGGAR